MKRYILTPKERQIIEQFLDNGLKLEGFRQLVYLARNANLDHLENDIELIRYFVQKAGNQ
jgi:hypothetical protein